MLRGPEAMHLESVIWTLLLGGILISQLMSFCWSYTTHTSTDNINGNPHSIALILLTFLAGCINNSSSLYLYPFVARWERRYVSALATGEGLSGIMVSLLALAQNGGTHPRFSTGVYFQGVSAYYIFPLLGFLYLLREQKRQEARKMTTTTTAATAATTIEETNNHATDIAAYKRLLLKQSTSNDHESENTLALPLSSSSSSSLPPSPPNNKPSVLHLIYPLLIAQFGISAWAYGVIPALTPISTRGYQHSGKTLQFSSFVSMALDPLSRALTHYFRCYRLVILVGLVNLLTILLAVAAGMAPRPPFWEWERGGLYVVVVNGGFTAAFAFCSTMVYFSIHFALQLKGEEGEKEKAGREEGLGGGGVVVAGAAAAFETLVVMKEEEEEEGREEGDGVGSSRSGLVVSALMEEETREGGKEDEEKQRLEQEQVLRWQEGFRWSSFVIQIGAFVGALATFLLVSCF